MRLIRVRQDAAVFMVNPRARAYDHCPSGGESMNAGDKFDRNTWVAPITSAPKLAAAGLVLAFLAGVAAVSGRLWAIGEPFLDFVEFQDFASAASAELPVSAPFIIILSILAHISNNQSMKTKEDFGKAGSIISFSAATFIALMGIFILSYVIDISWEMIIAISLPISVMAIFLFLVTEIHLNFLVN